MVNTVFSEWHRKLLSDTENSLSSKSQSVENTVSGPRILLTRSVRAPHTAPDTRGDFPVCFPLLSVNNRMRARVLVGTPASPSPAVVLWTVGPIC